MTGRHFYKLGGFRLDPVVRVLFRREELVPLPPKAVDTLLLLVERRGNVVDKETLFKEIWPDSFVEEGSLTRNVSLLRKVFAEESTEKGEKEWIETVPKRGYRYVGPFEETEGRGEAAGYSDVEPENLRADSTIGKAPPRRRIVLQVWAAIALAVIAVGGYLAYVRIWPHKASAAPRVMLVVLPVQNLTGDPSRDYLADGLTEELISQLGSLNPDQLGVIARTSSMAFRNTNKTVAEIARDLNVDYVVETSVRGAAQRLRFTAQLIRTRDQTHVWAQDFDRDPQDLVVLEDDLGRLIAREVSVSLTPTAHARIEHPASVSLASYQSYLQGRYYWNQRTHESMETGLNYFLESVKEDPRNARAFTGIADSYNTLLFYGYSNDVADMMKAQQAAQSALKIDDSLSEAHAALAYVYFMWTWQWPEAEREFRRAIELDDNYAPAHHWFALYLAAMGRSSEADQEIRIAESLDPVSPIVRTASAYIHFFGRDYDSAIGECQNVLASNPNFLVAHAVLGMAYAGKGMGEQAVSEFEKALDLSKQNPIYQGYLAYGYALTGNRPAAEKILAEMEDRSRRGIFVSQYMKALVYSALGEKEKAIEALGQARQQNDSGMIWWQVDPRIDSLRTDPRFQELRSEFKKAP
jgi:TolB-like protein/DNA-binding winged helix-turn-helix (wHTH) protein/Flp pilus assembly protein TadD